MKRLLFFGLLFFAALLSAQKKMSVVVNGLQRSALVFAPTVKQGKVPVLFVFHGHGGTARAASKNMDFQDYFPEAIVVFMQGIPGTRGLKVDPEGKKNGWQSFPADQHGRDIFFFDKVLDTLKKTYPVGIQRIYVAGHSNGARFANVLWSERGWEIAAIISVSGQGGLMVKNAVPVSMWMCMGTRDPIVPLSQQQLSIPIVEKNLAIDKKSIKEVGDLQIFKGMQNTELVVQIRTGGHEFPVDEIPQMVAFLKRQKKN